MKIIKKLKRELHETRASLLTAIKNLARSLMIIQRVLTQPLNLIYGVISALGTALLGVWFANINIIQSVFSSDALPSYLKFEFLFSMLATLFRNMAGLQLLLILFHVILWCIVSALWLEAMRLQHAHPRIRHQFMPAIFATLCIGAASIIGISLITPSITWVGLNVFVSDHFSGTLLLIITLVAEVMATKHLVRLISKYKI